MLPSSRRISRLLAAGAFALACLSSAHAQTQATVAVGPQYDTTHVYIDPKDVDAFVTSFIATFGGKSTPQGVATVTPTPSSTTTQLLLTPVGTLSVFGFKTPIPYPFGSERTGYLVEDIDQAVALARTNGAEVVVAPFPDPIGRDTVIRWPGGVNMQLYWHTKPSTYPSLQSIPDNRVYVSPDSVDAFVKSFVGFSQGHVVKDDRDASGTDIGRPGTTYRRVAIESNFGKLLVLVTDGHLPYPYGMETTGYAVDSLAATLAKAKAAHAVVLAGPYTANGNEAAMLKFPGGYVTEVHAPGN